VQGDRLLIEADYGLPRIIRPLIDFQDVLHFGDIVFIEFRHGRGRDAGRPAPPAQILTGGITA
jgi:hypothetical protein